MKGRETNYIYHEKELLIKNISSAPGSPGRWQAMDLNPWTWTNPGVLFHVITMGCTITCDEICTTYLCWMLYDYDISWPWSHVWIIVFDEEMDECNGLETGRSCLQKCIQNQNAKPIWFCILVLDAFLLSQQTAMCSEARHYGGKHWCIAITQLSCSWTLNMLGSSPLVWAAHYKFW